MTGTARAVAPRRLDRLRRGHDSGLAQERQQRNHPAWPGDPAAARFPQVGQMLFQPFLVQIAGLKALPRKPQACLP